jgi:hypothetical protein
MLMYEPVPFIKTFVTDLNTALGDQKSKDSKEFFWINTVFLEKSQDKPSWCLTCL